MRWVDGPDREKLLAAVPEADALLVRSATTVDAEVLAAAPKLKIVARAGVGLDNVDVDAATARGVLVVNAPTSNIHSAAEHALALLLSAARQIPAADATLREHTWKRSAFSGTEIFGKTVGVVGLGRIGQLVAQRLAAFGTHVVAYDPYVSAARAAQLGIELLTLDELLGRADFISVHLPKTKETAGLIGKENLAKTKPGVIIVNAARGGLIDEAALADAIASGHVRGAGLDVFSTEPCTDSPLFELPQVVVTPHLGASTAEAQDRAGTDVAESVKLALAGEFVPDAVNVGGGVVGEEVAPWLDLVRKLGLLVGVLSAELPVSLSIQVRGELASEDVDILRLSALRGLFSGVIEDPVTFVNAPALAAERGVEADISTATESPNHRSVVDVRAVYADGSVANVSGALSGPQLVEKIVQINGRNFDLRAEGVYLIVNYIDQPGTLGKIGTLLGTADINIHAAQLSEDAEGPGATILLRIDRDVPEVRRPCSPRSPRPSAPSCWKCGPHVKLAIIAGDGIGPEVVDEAVKVLDAVLPGVDKSNYDLGARRYHATGEVLPESVLDELRAHDAILLGAIGDPSVPSGLLERGLLLRIRFELDHHINLRPARLYPGVSSPLAGNPDIDFVVVREGTEGPYTGTGGAIRVGTPHEIATEVSVNTAFGVRRVVHDAFGRAAARRKQLTLVHKNNVLTYAGALWWRTVQEVGAEYPDVEIAYQHVDSATIHLVTDPGRFDVIVTDNLFGDIVTDLAAAVCGGIGLAASGNIDATRTNPSMFEPVHGSAPDIAGQGIADPTAAIMSVALLLSSR